MTAYTLTVEAEADLRGIIRYTRKQWSDTQLRRYVAKLEQGIASLAAVQGSFKDMSELFQRFGWRVANITTSSACRASARPHWSWQFFMSTWTS